MEQTQLLKPDPTGITAAIALLRAGNLVAFPTETVYGLGGDARDGAAVAAIYEAKGRPSFNPLIVHVANQAEAEKIGVFDGTAHLLAKRFWPGPLTLVLPLAQGHGIASLVTAGATSVALRVPAHPVARDLLGSFGGPLAAPSANPSGRISPTTAAHVMAGLDGKIGAVIDAGPCTVGLESTILGGDPLALLRQGGLAREEIETLLGPLAATGNNITAPGQLTSHYAPGAPVRLNAQGPVGDEVMLGFGPDPCDVNLSETGDLHEAAARLFEALHQLDATGRPIAVARVPNTGLGAAINDRLKRAAAPR